MIKGSTATALIAIAKMPASPLAPEIRMRRSARPSGRAAARHASTMGAAVAPPSTEPIAELAIDVDWYADNEWKELDV